MAKILIVENEFASIRIGDTDEKVKEEVVATPVEPVKEESELDKLKRELEEARDGCSSAEDGRECEGTCGTLSIASTVGRLHQLGGEEAEGQAVMAAAERHPQAMDHHRRQLHGAHEARRKGILIQSD